MYKHLLRPLLFSLEAETAHHISFRAIKALFRIPLLRRAARRYFTVRSPLLEREVFGLKFPNPVGLAAGFDKDAKLIDELASFGFGFIEIGTVTPKPQDGNPKPRLFRLLDDQGIVNRMGFNNGGLEAVRKRLATRKGRILVGGNIGKNKATPNSDAIRDYEMGFNVLFDVVDYFVVNVSSPNTPNLRELQDKKPLTRLLTALQAKNRARPNPKPVLLKIAPDLTNSQLDDIIDIVRETGIQGVIATNTTISREGLATPEKRLEEIGAGGLSGKPLRARATEVIRYLHRRSGGAFPIIGVGGIYSPQDAQEKLEAGASLVQVYSGFIYEGPSMVRRINQHLKARAEQAGKSQS
jgi:dihydroorotate dehydrogenase